MPTIRNVEFIVLREELGRPIRLSIGELRWRYYGLIRVEADDGSIGWGETFINFPTWAFQERRHTIDSLGKIIIGMDPLRIEYVWMKLYDAIWRLGLIWGKGALMQALAGIDMALWDLKGRLMNQPIYELLGGLYRDRVKVYATGLDPDDPIRHAAQIYKRHGVNMFKLRVGFNIDEDTRLVERFIEELGDGVGLMVDANMAWSPLDAYKFISGVDDLGLIWVEEPINMDDLHGLRWLRGRIKTPIAGGENSHDLRDALKLLSNKVLDYIMPDVSKTGGITLCRRIAGLAEAHGVAASPHYYGSNLGLAATIQFSAATPVVKFIQRDVSESRVRDRVIKDQLVVRDGYIDVPDKPGIGVEVDETIIDRFRIDQ